MAAHHLAMSRVRAFAEATTGGAEIPRSTSIDIPFIIADVEDCTVIFQLGYRMRVPHGEPLLMTDPLIGSISNQRGFAEAVAPPRSDTVEAPRDKVS